MTARRRAQRGAALLVAMVLLSVVATLAAGMVWQQWRAVQVEAAERARAQSGLILTGALDWARLMLAENAKLGNGHTKLGELLGQPLAEIRLSTLLAADRDNSADSDIDAFLSGSMDDAQARYNLRNLLVDGKVAPAQLAVLERLCAAAGLPTASAGQIAAQFLQSQGADPASPLSPQRLADLSWLGLDGAMLARLTPLLVLLPQPTPVNVNTAPREVLAAVLPAVDLGGADRLVRQRQNGGFADLDAVTRALGSTARLEPRDVDVRSNWFVVHGRLRLGERALEEDSLVYRNPTRQVVPVQRERRALLGQAAP